MTLIPEHDLENWWERDFSAWWMKSLIAPVRPYDPIETLRETMDSIRRRERDGTLPGVPSLPQAPEHSPTPT